MIRNWIFSHFLCVCVCVCTHLALQDLNCAKTNEATQNQTKEYNREVYPSQVITAEIIAHFYIVFCCFCLST